MSEGHLVCVIVAFLEAYLLIITKYLDVILLSKTKMFRHYKVVLMKKFYFISIYTTEYRQSNEIIVIIAPLSDIPMFYIKYLTMHKVHMYASAMRQLLYGCAYVREIIHSLKLVDYHPVHTHKPYNNLHLSRIPISLL